jgi:1-aminocyclopropane-1-carboxylate deaminase/D-cysteine desulfhydrase-like pyridoxal-dependent ACC family enzyme
VTVGKLQSNHARQTAAAAAKIGMSCVLLLEELAANSSDDYHSSGNALLNRILGATTERFAPGQRTEEIVGQRLRSLDENGHKPYYIPVGGSNAIGSLGYVACAVELGGQAAELATDFQHLVLATGSGGTHAGMLVGLEAIGSELSVMGYSVSDDAPTQITKVAEVAGLCGELVGDIVVPEEKITVDDAFVGPGYGRPDARTFEAIELFARTEGIILDPVYTGKAAAGLIDHCRAGRIGKDERVVFLHTGGQAGAFAYQAVL